MNSEPTEWDEKREHERDLEYESRQDDESWNVDEPEPEPDTHSEDPYSDHMRRMLRFGLDWINDNASKTNGCEHKYAEQETAPLGVKCVRCGHFVGAWE